MGENSERNIKNRSEFAREFLKRNPNNFVFLDEALYSNPHKVKTEPGKVNN
jgi:hypothetical protein